MKDAPKKKCVLITGSRPGGIGQAEAKRLAIDRYDVLIAEKSEENAEAAVEPLRREGLPVNWIKADLTKEKDVSNVVDHVKRTWGRLDALVNNAGAAGSAVKDRLADLSAAHLIQLFLTNLVSTFLITKAVIGEIFAPQRFGVVVFTSSCNGADGYGHWGQLAYAISKAGLAPLLTILTAQYGPKGLRFYTIRPSIVETDSPNWQRRRLEEPDWSAIEGSMIPGGYLPRPSDVANVVSFLVSPEAAFLSGNEIRIDGGMLRVGIGVPGMNMEDPRHSYVTLMRNLEEAKQFVTIVGE